MSIILDIQNIEVSIDEYPILQHITLPITEHAITAVIGPSGCGKSTLLRSMIGYIHSPRKCVTILGKPLQSYSQNELARQMAFLPQVPNMPKDMTVEELVYCGRYPYQMWWKNTAKEDREIVDYALGITKTNHLRNQLIPSLSGGERQRVWIAMALAQQPKLLVLDEPTTYLDINHQLEIMELLKRLNDEQGLTVLMVLHELTQAVQYSHYMAIIKDGHLVTAGDTKEIVSDELFRDVFSVDVQIDTFDDKQYVRVKGLVE